MRMDTAKDEVRKLLDRLPEEASLEDIQYQVYVLDEISRGVAEIDRGDVVGHEDVKRRLAKWLDE
jgi:predicted transcriptional regulator